MLEDSERKKQFDSLFYQIVDVTHWVDGFDREKYKEVMIAICKMLHITKAVAEFFVNMAREKENEGEYYCDYDTGRGDKVVVNLRIVTGTQAVVRGQLFIAEEDEISDEDRGRAELVMRVILGMVARRRLQKAVEQFGFHDDAGYPNSRNFFRFVDIAGNEGRLKGMYAAHFDLHNFTMVNQEIGRLYGDEVIRNYFGMIRDSIGETGVLTRLGGDKFICIFSEEKKDVVLGLLSGTPVPYGENKVKRVLVSAAVGVYKIVEDSFQNQNEVMDKIMMASQMAKRSEEGAIVFYDVSRKNQSDHIKKVRKDFREALAGEEFRVFYQPKVNIDTGEITGAEALCRWIKPEDGRIISPMEFIPILEMNTDICDLDFYMLDHACRDIRRWLDEGILKPDEAGKVIRVSVNLSRKHLVDVDLLEHIMSIIDQNRVPHRFVEVELTETTTDVQFRDLKRVVRGLQDQGVSTAVDDFGVGYSSLNLIREIPWNVLKIDRCFLPQDDEPEDSITFMMFKHVISLAQDIGLECVVEGVETVKHLELLRKYCCNIAQGFYYDRPIPVKEFEQRLLQKKYVM